VLDVGCGEGRWTIELARRFGFSITGLDPVPRHIEVARAAAGDAGPVFLLGTAEDLPAPDATVDLVWCRDVLVHVADLPTAYAEFARVLKPGGRVLAYQMVKTELLEEREAGWLWRAMGVVPTSADPQVIEAAIAGAGLTLAERVELTTEWGEYAQERTGRPGRKMLHAARLRRNREAYIARFGQAAYEMMLGDCLWHVYAMLGKLTRLAYVLAKPA